MKKKGNFIILVLLVLFSSALWAQSGDEGKMGLLFELPLTSNQKTIGIIKYLDNGLVLKPFVDILLDFNAAWDEFAGTPKDKDSTWYLEPGVAIDKILSTNGPLEFYAGAAVSLIYDLTKVEPDGGNVDEDTTYGIRIAPRVGTQYMFTDSFGIFGNLQFGILYTLRIDKRTDPAGTLLWDDRWTSLTFSTVESALGVIFFFK